MWKWTDSYFWFCHLQEATDQAMSDFIFHQYELLFDQYMKERALIPKGNLHELAFHALDKQPLEEIQAIYDQFGWSGFEAMRPKVDAYTQALQDFKKNDHRQLPQEWKDIVYQRWRGTFDEFGYSKDHQ